MPTFVAVSGLPAVWSLGQGSCCETKRQDERGNGSYGRDQEGFSEPLNEIKDKSFGLPPGRHEALYYRSWRRAFTIQEIGSVCGTMFYGAGRQAAASVKCPGTLDAYGTTWQVKKIGKRTEQCRRQATVVIMPL